MSNVYLDPPVMQDLKALSAHTRISVAAYIREAVDDLLKKHGRELRKARK